MAGLACFVWILKRQTELRKEWALLMVAASPECSTPAQWIAFASPNTLSNLHQASSGQILASAGQFHLHLCMSLVWSFVWPE
jgi:hypothetical protein